MPRKWKFMSEADRVFPTRHDRGAQGASSECRLIHAASRRKGGGTSTRVVEVVHVRRGKPKPSVDRPSLASGVRAEAWPDGFRAKVPPPLPPHDPPPAAPEPARPTVHVMAGWASSPQPPTPLPVAPPVETPVAEGREARASKPRSPKRVGQGFADPFAVDDSGTNCLRCGHRVEPARERRGLWTCSACG